MFATSVQAQTQTDMNNAAAKTFAASDKAMNEVYERLVAKISAPGRTALREAQRTWLRFRDQECEFETLGSAGGSVRPMVVDACRTRLTDVRGKDLGALVACPEGDVACGNQ